jgi:hypothetical protein
VSTVVLVAIVAWAVTARVRVAPVAASTTVVTVATFTTLATLAAVAAVVAPLAAGICVFALALTVVAAGRVRVDLVVAAGAVSGGARAAAASVCATVAPVRTLRTVRTLRAVRTIGAVGAVSAVASVSVVVARGLQGRLAWVAGGTCIQAHSRSSSSLHLSGRRLAKLVQVLVNVPEDS